MKEANLMTKIKRVILVDDNYETKCVGNELPLLPTDLWIQVWKYLERCKLVDVMILDKSFHQVLVQDDRIWIYHCINKYKCFLPILLSPPEIVEELQVNFHESFAAKVQETVHPLSPHDITTHFVQKYLDGGVCSSWYECSRLLTKKCCHSCSADPDDGHKVEVNSPFNDHLVCRMCIKLNQEYRLCTQTRAFTEYKLSSQDLTNLPRRRLANPYHKSWCSMKLYQEKTIIEMCFDKMTHKHAARRDEVTQVMKDRGMEDSDIEKALSSHHTSMSAFLDGRSKKRAKTIIDEMYGVADERVSAPRKKKKLNPAASDAYDSEPEQQVTLTRRQQSVRENKQEQLIEALVNAEMTRDDALKVINEMKIEKKGPLYQYYINLRTRGDANDAVKAYTM
ncbi:hypothetical protein AKO1_005007 [Acrasis kona]|uniref:XPA C-terminal domain-containing protein n=1 Tax=Acrasis kona TaxID=1008807 RepID=A0AAW2Z4R1_9EUKA